MANTNKKIVQDPHKLGVLIEKTLWQDLQKKASEETISVGNLVRKALKNMIYKNNS